MPQSSVLLAYFVGVLLAFGAGVGVAAGLAMQWLLYRCLRNTSTLTIDAALGAAAVGLIALLVIVVPVPRNTVTTERNGSVMTSTMDRYQGPLLPALIAAATLLPIGFEA